MIVKISVVIFITNLGEVIVSLFLQGFISLIIGPYEFIPKGLPVSLLPKNALGEMIFLLGFLLLK